MQSQIANRKSKIPIMRYLNLAGYLAIPLAFAVHYWIGHGKPWEPTATFVLAALGVIPLARLMGESTEHLSERTGPTWGGSGHGRCRCGCRCTRSS